MASFEKKDHGNTGFRVKNLRHTKDCPHRPSKSGFAALVKTQASYCAVNGCNTDVTTPGQRRGCHVVAANQNTKQTQKDENENGLRAKRFIVVLCDGCNKIYDTPLNLRGNASYYELDGCDCGHVEEEKHYKTCKQCKDNDDKEKMD